MEKEKRDGKEIRVRCLSSGNIEEMLAKRKGEEREAFDRSKRTARSPEVKKNVEENEEAGWKREIKKIKEGMEEKMRELKKEMKREMDRMIKEIEEREERWREEKERLEEKIKRMEKMVEKVEKKEEDEEKEIGKEGVGREEREVEKKVEEIEWRIEMKEREERKRNLLIRGLRVKEGKRKEAVEEIMRDIGAEVEVEEVKRLGGNGKEGKEVVWVKLRDERQRREVMEKKRKLMGRKERILEDWTWKERRMRWKLEEVAREETRAGKRVWIRYGGIKISEQWWKWDEMRGVLVDGRGKVREEKKGEKMEGKGGKTGGM